MPSATFHIRPVQTAADLDATVRLFNDYAASIGVDLCFQGFAAEVASLPGQYAPPTGALLLARDSHNEPLGCVALRPTNSVQCCEMKRLYVSPRGRGQGLGRALVAAISAEAVRLGYREIRLDTLPTMTEALALYQSTGFVPIEPYYNTPVAGTHFLGRSLGG